MTDEVRMGTSVIVPHIVHGGEILPWLSSNCGGRESWYLSHWSYLASTYTFGSEEDATAFKLRFGL